MHIMLHEWFDRFIEVNNLDKSIDLVDSISKELNKKYADHVEFAPWYSYDEAKVYSLDEFIAAGITPKDFLYDRSTNSVLMNIRQALMYHEGFAMKLGAILLGKDTFDDECAAIYSTKFGFFLSSVSYKNIYVGQETKLTKKEQLAFRDYTFIKEL